MYNKRYKRERKGKSTILQSPGFNVNETMYIVRLYVGVLLKQCH